MRTTARHFSLTCARCIQSTRSYTISSVSNLILSSPLRSSPQNDHISLTKIPCAFLFSSLRATCPAHLTATVYAVFSRLLLPTLPRARTWSVWSTCWVCVVTAGGTYSYRWNLRGEINTDDKRNRVCSLVRFWMYFLVHLPRFFRAVETAGAMLTGHLSRFSTGDCSRNIITQLCRSGNVCSVHCQHAFLIIICSHSRIVEKFEYLGEGRTVESLNIWGRHEQCKVTWRRH